MKMYGIRGQVTYFAFGTWAGAAAWIAIEAMQRTEVKSWGDTESGLRLLVTGYIFFALLTAIPFAAWLLIRRRWKQRPTVVLWIAPLVAGFAYLPSLGALLPLMIHVTGQGQGPLIGTAVATYLFGAPVVLAEVCLRIAGKHIEPSSHP